jgi:hypothetical protein
MTSVTGGCLCGRVRYTATGEAKSSYLCHCRDCQRFTGSAFLTGMAFPASSLKVQGELKTFANTSDAGRQVRRLFCPNCGSGVFAEADVMPGLTIVVAGTLDEPADFIPSVDLYWSRAHPWLHSGGERTHFAEMPP